MTIYYLDLLNGNDANNGLSFAARKKRLQNLTTSPQAGDIIRVMKSPDPTSIGSATWSNSSASITLNVANTATINACDNNSFTASANVTSTYPTTNTDLRLGANFVQLAIGSAFTTGKIAYASCATVDLSAFQQISLFFRNNASISANTIYLDLCSDATGDVPVVSFAIPSKGAQSSNISPFTFDYGANLPNNINSIAFRATNDPGTLTIYFDNIIACKAPSAPDSLTLNSLIGLNTLTDPEWIPIKSINGTTVELNIGANHFWKGTSGSQTTYKLEPIKLQDVLSTLPAGFDSSVSPTGFAINFSGTATGGPVNIEFGWDTTDMSTQTGFTAFDWQIYSGRGLFYATGGTQDYIKYNKLISIRPYNACTDTTNLNYVELGEVHFINPIVSGISGLGKNTYIDKVYIISTNSHSSFTKSSLIGNYLNCSYMNYTQTGANIPISSADTLNLKSLVLNACHNLTLNNIPNGFIKNLIISPTNTTTNTPLNNINASFITIENLIISGSWSKIFNFPGNACINITNLNTQNSTVPLITDISVATTRGIINIQNVNSTGVFNAWMHFGILKSTTTEVHTAGGVAWELFISNTNFVKYYLNQDWYKQQNNQIAKIPVKANKLTTVKIWTKRLFNTTKSAFFIRPEIPGVNDYVVATSSAEANTWEELTISFTPSINTVVDLYIGAQYDATNAGQAFYFDDLSVTIAD